MQEMMRYIDEDIKETIEKKLKKFFEEI